MLERVVVEKEEEGGVEGKIVEGGRKEGEE